MQRGGAVWMLCAWVSGQAVSSTDRTIAVPMAVDDDTGRVAVGVAVSGAGAGSWMIDTGSSRSAVNQTLATSLELPSVARTEVVTASGNDMRPVIRLPDVRVGCAVATNLMAMVLPDDRLPGIQGLLGQDFLGRFNYTLDYRQGRLEWDGREGKGPRLPLLPSEGRFLVDLPQGEGPALRMVPDSGAAAVVVFRKGGRIAVPLAATLGARLDLRGVAGDRAGDAVRLRGLRVGNRRLRDHPALVLDVSEDHAWPDGLLPLHLFARVTLNAPAGYLIVD